MSAEEDLAVRFLQADAALARGESEPARRLFDILTLDAPWFAPGWDGLGRALAAQGRFDQAEQAFRRAAALDRKSWRIRLHHARSRRAAGDPRGAAAVLRQALRLAPGERLLHYELALTQRDFADPAAARRSLDRALELPDRDVADAEVLLIQGRVCMDVDDLDGAESAFERACLYAPDNPELLQAWADCARRRGDEIRAELLARRAFSLAPHDIQAARLLVELACDREDWAAAEARAAALEPLGGEALARALRGRVALLRGRLGEARAHSFASLRRATPESAAAVHLSLENLRALRGDTALCRCYRLVVRAVTAGGEYYRSFLVLAPDRDQAARLAGEIQQALDPDINFEVIEIGEAGTRVRAVPGVAQLSLLRTVFPKGAS